MSGRVVEFAAGQVLVAASALTMCSWVHLNGVTCLCLALVALSAVVHQVQAPGAGPGSCPSLVAAWACTLLSPAFIAWSSFTLDAYHAVIAWLMALVVLPAALSTTQDRTRTAWKLLVVGWVFLGCLIWLGQSYFYNLSGEFFIGIVSCLAFLIGSKFWFRMKTPMILASNTLILLLVGLPLADFVTRTTFKPARNPQDNKIYYSFEAAKKDPDAFVRWWEYYSSQCSDFEKQVFIKEEGDVVPYRLKPNSRAFLFENLVSINGNGFRGEEIRQPKGNCYRIVVIGESTTFDLTMGREDKPWPEILEATIRERIHTARPVQVINAGVPGYTFLYTLNRFPGDILPLQPDLVLCYHGYNSFNLIYPTLPSVRGRIPAYQPRPLKILARCEYRLKVILFRHSRRDGMTGGSEPKVDPIETPYADAYRQLVQMTRTNGIQLALANFSMAVNDQSGMDLVEFYRQGFPSVRREIKANAIHSRLVREIVARNPDVYFVDTKPDLDGHPENFVDLVHFTQTGRRRIAENVFNGIRKILERDLGP